MIQIVSWIAAAEVRQWQAEQLLHSYYCLLVNIKILLPCSAAHRYLVSSFCTQQKLEIVFLFVIFLV